MFVGLSIGLDARDVTAAARVSSNVFPEVESDKVCKEDEEWEVK